MRLIFFLYRNYCITNTWTVLSFYNWLYIYYLSVYNIYASLRLWYIFLEPFGFISLSLSFSQIKRHQKKLTAAASPTCVWLARLTVHVILFCIINNPRKLLFPTFHEPPAPPFFIGAAGRRGRLFDRDFWPSCLRAWLSTPCTNFHMMVSERKRLISTKIILQSTSDIRDSSGPAKIVPYIRSTL